MLNKFFLFFFCFAGSILISDEIPPVEVVKKELDVAERDFNAAKLMFNPWYGCPLLTGSGNVKLPGVASVQPYLYVFDNYGHFDSSRKAHSVHDMIIVNPVLSFGLGLINRVDASLDLQGFYQKKEKKKSGNIGDTSLGLGLAVLIEGPYVPALKISLKEYFPTGKYQKLKSHKPDVDSTGKGSFITQMGFNISKVTFWTLKHPMQFRFAFAYDLPTTVKVKGFNTYGGGVGTDGKAKPGKYFSTDFGYEFSCTQKVVLALDVTYEYHCSTTFKGTYGTTLAGDVASLGGPSRDVICLAPALEYNFSPDLALITGVWFSVWGRNSTNFFAGVITVSYTF